MYSHLLHKFLFPFVRVVVEINLSIGSSALNNDEARCPQPKS